MFSYSWLEPTEGKKFNKKGISLAQKRINKSYSTSDTEPWTLYSSYRRGGSTDHYTITLLTVYYICQWIKLIFLGSCKSRRQTWAYRLRKLTPAAGCEHPRNPTLLSNPSPNSSLSYQSDLPSIWARKKTILFRENKSRHFYTIFNTISLTSSVLISFISLYSFSALKSQIRLLLSSILP